MDNITQMIQKLKSMGYRNSQVVRMIESCIGNKSIEALNELEIKKLSAFLEDHVDFGLKCLRVAKKVD